MGKSVFYLSVLHFSWRICTLLPKRYTGILSLKQLSRSGSKKGKLWGEDLFMSKSTTDLSFYGRVNSWRCVITGLRQKTSSTLSLGVCSGRTTTPHTSHADSRALLTSTWPPSAASSTMTSSTRFFLAATHCSTSPPGLSTGLPAYLPHSQPLHKNIGSFLIFDLTKTHAFHLWDTVIMSLFCFNCSSAWLFNLKDL